MSRSSHEISGKFFFLTKGHFIRDGEHLMTTTLKFLVENHFCVARINFPQDEKEKLACVREFLSVEHIPLYANNFHNNNNLLNFK